MMTSASTTEMLIQSIKEGLTCPICKGFYRDAQHLFSCSHTVCKDCMERSNEQAVDGVNRLRQGRSRSHTSSITCPVCGTIQSPGNIGPALFFNNVKHDIVALEECLSLGSFAKAEKRHDTNKLLTFTAKDGQECGDVEHDGVNDDSLATEGHYENNEEEDNVVKEACDKYKLEMSLPSQLHDDNMTAIHHVHNAREDKSSPSTSQDESHFLVNLPTLPLADQTLQRLAKRSNSKEEDRSQSQSSTGNKKRRALIYESSSKEVQNRHEDNHFVTPEEKMLLTDHESEHTYVASPIIQSESLATWGRDIMDDEAKDIQAMINEHSIVDAKHPINKSESVNSQLRRWQHQDVLLPSSQLTVNSNNGNECEHEASQRICSALLSADAESSPSEPNVPRGSSQNQKTTFDDVHTLNQMSLASWGKEIEDNELMGIEDMMEQQAYLQQKRKEQQSKLELRVDNVLNDDGGDNVDDDDTPNETTHYQASGTDIEHMESVEIGANRETFPCVVVEYHALNRKSTSILQRCESKRWITVLKMRATFDANNVGNEKDIVWLVEEEDEQYYKCRRTLSYLNALVQGLLIVSTEWLFDSCDGDNLLKAQNYEISGSTDDKVVGAPHRSRRMDRDEDGRSTLFSNYSFQFVSLRNGICVDFNDPNTPLRILDPDQLILDKDDVDNKFQEHHALCCHPTEVLDVKDLVRFIHLSGGCMHTKEEASKLKSDKEELEEEIQFLGILVSNDMVLQNDVTRHTKIVPKGYFKEVVSINWVLESIFNQHVFDFKEWRFAE